jgi:hypothetical protein
MPDYSKAKIYNIISGDLRYYGSTCETYLSRRLQGHLQHFRKNTQFQTSFPLLETGDFKIELVENYPCSSKEELHKRERWWIENNTCVNHNLPSRTNAEYQRTPKMKEYKRKWYEENKDRQGDKSKEKYKQNPEIMKQYQKKYYEENKKKVLDRCKEKVICDSCKKELSRGNFSKHKKFCEKK